MVRPVRINPYKYIYIAGRKCLCVLRVGDGRENDVHMREELHQRGTILGVEVLRILANQAPNLRNLAFALVNAMRKDIK